MAIIGLSIIFASVVYVAVRPQPWLIELLISVRDWSQRMLGFGAVDSQAQQQQQQRRGDGGTAAAPVVRILEVEEENEKIPDIALVIDDDSIPDAPPPIPPRAPRNLPLPIPPRAPRDYSEKVSLDRLAMPPPPLPTIPRIIPPQIDEDDDDSAPGSGASTPKAKSFSPPTLAAPSFPAINSAQRARSNPIPNRGPHQPSSSSLTPPPTHSAPPTKPSRAVVLTPGHSPLDWARIAESPTADLRNLGPDAPATLLRVPPSLLRQMTGRKGKDAWMAIGGRVYNVSPYADFHPGGKGELMRGAGKDATQLFGEVHPWVNYDGMLRACLVGVLVAENEESKMDEMD